jgi:hypothetical protein
VNSILEANVAYAMKNGDDSMINNQPNGWHKLGLSLLLAFLLGLAAYVPLRTLPAVAANNLPDCVGEVTPPAPGTEVFTVIGTVVTSDGTTPVECVHVIAFSGPDLGKAFTDGSGRYTLTLKAGIYDFVFHTPLTSALAFQSRRWIREAQVLDVTLPPGHLISGTVYSDATKANPVGGVNVFASNPVTSVGIGATPTLSDGTYGLVLEPGRWELTFTPSHFQSLGPTRTEVIIAESNITRDIILRPGFTITGQVTADGAGIAGVEIFAQDFSNNEDGYGITATDGSGRYSGTLPAGTFDILFFAPPFSGFGSTVVTNLTGLSDTQNVPLPIGHTISGTVRCGTGLPNTFVHADPDLPSLAGQFGGWGRYTADDGYYALALQPSTYTLSADWPPSGSPDRLVPTVVITQDLTLDFAACTVYLPIIFKPRDLVDDFDDGQDPNALGGPIGHGWPLNCMPTLDHDYDPVNAFGGSAFGYRLTYTVTQSCYAVWETGLQGYSFSDYSDVTFQIKGKAGGEEPHIYLQDTSDCQINASCRHYVQVSDLRLEASQITTNWQQARVPLSIYKDNGVNLHSLQFFQIVFEWKNMNGTIYVDEIRFE